MKSIGEILKQTGLQDGIERASDLPREPLPDLPAEDPACPLCDGAGFVRKAVQLGHPDFGRAFQTFPQEGVDSRRTVRLRLRITF